MHISLLLSIWYLFVYILNVLTTLHCKAWVKPPISTSFSTFPPTNLTSTDGSSSCLSRHHGGRCESETPEPVDDWMTGGWSSCLWLFYLICNSQPHLMSTTMTITSSWYYIYVCVYIYMYVWNKSPIMSYEGNKLDGGVLGGILMATSTALSLIPKSVSEA